MTAATSDSVLKFYGPVHLLSHFSEWVENPVAQTLYCIELNADRQVVTVTSLPTQTQHALGHQFRLPDPEIKVPELLNASSVFLVLLYIMGSQESESFLREQLRTWSSDTDWTPRSLLDVLVTKNDVWWSALCADENCCPADGRPLPESFIIPSTQPFDAEASSSANLLYDKFLEVYEDFARTKTLSQDSADILCTMFIDLRLRDAVMTHAMKDVTKNQNSPYEFIAAVAEMSPRPSSLSMAALFAVAQEQTEEAHKLLERAHDLDEHYNLTKLIRHALSTKFPPELVRHMFKHLHVADILAGRKPQKPPCLGC